MESIRLDYARPQKIIRSASWAIDAMLLILVSGFILWIAASKLMGSTVCGNVGSARATIRVLDCAVDQFEHDVGRYPTDAEGLAALVSRPPGMTEWKGPYFKGDLTDPWASPYVYRSKSGAPEIISAGRDGKVNTADDLHN